LRKRGGEKEVPFSFEGRGDVLADHTTGARFKEEVKKGRTRAFPWGSGKGVGDGPRRRGLSQIVGRRGQGLSIEQKYNYGGAGASGILYSRK